MPMDASLSADLVRHAVRKTFAELGLSDADLAAMEESLLVKEGRFLARTYAAGQCRAMWLIDVRLIQFYSPQGEMLRTIDLVAQDLAQHAQDARQAA